MLTRVGGGELYYDVRTSVLWRKEGGGTLTLPKRYATSRRSPKKNFLPPNLDVHPGDLGGKRSSDMVAERPTRNEK